MDAEQELFAIFRAEVDEQIEDLAAHLGRSPSRWKVDRLFQISHNVKGAARLVGADLVRDAAHALEDLFSALRGGSELDQQKVELARRGADLLEQCFAALDGADPPDLTPFRNQVEAVTNEPSNEPAEAQGQGGVAATTVGSAVAADPTGPSPEDLGGNARNGSGDTVRIGADKLEGLAGLASELVTQVFEVETFGAVASQVARQLAAALQADSKLRKNPALRDAVRLSRELARSLTEHSTVALRVSEEVQSTVRSLRMVPIDAIRTLLSRSLRDACRSTSKAADLTLSGGGTEVDRAVLEHLRNPLVHLIRNAVAHGIERPEERSSAGKDPKGRVELRARSFGPWVEIVVADDGRGIDAAKVRDTAVAKGLITAEQAAELDEGASLRMLFLAGMSTSEEITELAGRGVGLDVVASEMRRIGGDASITTELGRGSEIVLRVPLTRLITSGIVVRVDSQPFAFSTADVERTLRVDRSDLNVVGSEQSLMVEDKLIRVTPLATVLKMGFELPDRLHAVVLNQGGVRRAFLVDEVSGQRDFILQPLPWNLRGAFGLAGTAVLDGGDILLVLDTGDLLGARTSRSQWAEQRQSRPWRVLVVDDSTTSRTLERNILRNAGYEVITAVDGREALELLARESVDLVVSDVEMPHVDGFELTRRVRAIAEMEALPVILVTSLGSEEHRRQGAEAGADAYIEKGAFDQDELLRTVARLL